MRDRSPKAVGNSSRGVESFNEPAPANAWKEGVGGDFEIHVSINEGDHPRSAAPTRLCNRIMQDDETGRTHWHTFEFYSAVQCEAVWRQASWARRFGDCQLWAILELADFSHGGPEEPGSGSVPSATGLSHRVRNRCHGSTIGEREHIPRSRLTLMLLTVTSIEQCRAFQLNIP